MKIEGKDDGLLRKYLLGELNEAEEQELEKQLLADDELSELVLAEEDELVDDYLDGELSEDERERFNTYFMLTPQRRRKLNFAQALRRFEPVFDAKGGNQEETQATKIDSLDKLPSPKPKVLSSSRWHRISSSASFKIAATVIVAAGLVGVWRLYIYQSEVQKGLAALARAYPTERPIEARVSELNYAPYSDTRGGDEGKFDANSLNLAELTLLDEVSQHPSPQAHHALALVYLLKKELKLAIAEFDEALKGDPNNARLHSDYGAALLEAGKARQASGQAGAGFEEWANSLDHLSKALELDGSLLEALFNRALCREHMLLRQAAADDWRTYIEKDPNSRWTDEARERLAALENRSDKPPETNEQKFQAFVEALRDEDEQKTWSLIIGNRDEGGSHFEKKLLTEYLELLSSGRAKDAIERLARLSYAAKVGQSRGNDRFATDLVRFYESANLAARTSAIHAGSLIEAGHRHYQKADFDAALDCYGRGKTEFDRAGDLTESMYAEYLIGLTCVQQSKIDLGITILETLTRTCRKEQYNWLQSQTLRALCGAKQLSRDFSEAIKDVDQSIELCEQADDVLGAIRARYQLGEVYCFVENARKALELYAADLPRARVYLTRPENIWARYFSISRAFDQLNFVQASIDFQNEALLFANETKAQRLICRSLNHLGWLLSKCGKYGDAEKKIKLAIDIGNSLPEKAVRDEVIAYSYMQLGSLYRKSGDPEPASENYDRAIRSYDELDNKLFAFTARKDKLLCCMEGAKCPSVEREMERVINLFEGHRTKILEEANRNTFFDAGQGIYDVAIEFEYFKKNDMRKAFEYSEQSRGRSLADLASARARPSDGETSDRDVLHPPSAPSMNYSKILKQVPEQSQILQYAVLKDVLIIWVVSTDSIEIETVPISKYALIARVNNFLRLVMNASEVDETFSREATYLYDLLIKPVELKLDGSKQLCIVPDKILCYLPFGALMPRASTYLIEERDLMLSPSSNIFNMCSAYAREKSSSSPETGLIVGNPAFDWSEYHNLSNLESAADEAKAIAGYYQASAITGTAATRRRVIGEMQRSNVIHLATHAITDEWDPRRSKLILAKDPDAGGVESNNNVLQAKEIYSLDLSRVRLVVLSACQSAVEKYYGGEGMVGLSRPFIANRIPLVVASLWPVESRSTARLMTSFHRYRKTGSGMATVPALCRAQREMINGPNRDDHLPRNWASFTTIGGYANF